MEEKQQLTRQLDEAHGKLGAVLTHLAPSRAVSPVWTVKEVVAHITGWDDATIKMLHAHATGEPLDAPEWISIDQFNEQSVETRKPLSYEQTVREWELTRIQLKNLIDDIPVDKMVEPLEFLWGRSGTVAQLVAIMIHHEAGHATKLEKLASIPPEVY